MICEEYVIEELMKLKDINKSLTEQIVEQEEVIAKLQNLIDLIGKEAEIRKLDYNNERYISFPSVFESEEKFELIAHSLNLMDYD